LVWPLELLNRQFTDFFRIADGRADLDDLLRDHLGNRVIAINLGIPTIATTHSDGSRPPVPNDRDQQCGAGADGAVG